MSNATLNIEGKEYSLPVIKGTEGEFAVDISKLRDQSQYITLDDGLGNTGSCTSAITFIDGDKGILRYRGYPIEELAEKSTFVETAWTIIWGRLPTESELRRFSGLLTEHELLHEGIKHHFDGFPIDAPPMAILSAMINSIGCYYQDLLTNMSSEADFEDVAARLISKVRTISAAAYKMSIGRPIIYGVPEYSYVQNFLHMMFSLPNRPYIADPDIVKALNLFLILHADHEQNCSTSTVRMVASSGANLFASVAAGVCALWGPLHGGANQAAVQMLEEIQKANLPVKDFVEKVKRKENGIKLMGFGHRVYKNFDPRSKILHDIAKKILNKKGQSDELLDIAQELAEVALKDEYFIERKLYPNVDFYSGIIMRAIGIPLNMFTVMFAIGRMPGWIANWKEVYDNKKQRIYRPRQIYTGKNQRPYELIDKRISP
ncbi:MAG: citrate synthase [Fibromonadaceae bacterium]|jgi:citrate synthase|nr:citrate synthase [Fibromonadaceae bacterium]